MCPRPLHPGRSSHNPLVALHWWETHCHLHLAGARDAARNDPRSTHLPAKLRRVEISCVNIGFPSDCAHRSEVSDGHSQRPISETRKRYSTHRSRPPTAPVWPSAPTATIANGHHEPVLAILLRQYRGLQSRIPCVARERSGSSIAVPTTVPHRPRLSRGRLDRPDHGPSKPEFHARDSCWRPSRDTAVPAPPDRLVRRRSQNRRNTAECGDWPIESPFRWAKVRWCAGRH